MGICRKAQAKLQASSEKGEGKKKRKQEPVRSKKNRFKLVVQRPNCPKPPRYNGTMAPGPHQFLRNIPQKTVRRLSNPT
jgi:hypothetical protein